MTHDPELEQQIKEQLLDELIEHMNSQRGESLRPKGVAVEVAAADKGALSEGLDKAKEVVSEAPTEEDDEHRMMQLLAEDEDEEDE